MNSAILLTGGSGLLGVELLRLDPTLVAPGHEELDVASLASFAAAVERHRPAVILHAAAITPSGEVRRNPDAAILANIVGTANAAVVAIRNRLRLVYLSTDYVYADTPGPHKEDEPLLPINEYSWTKLGGEAAVRLVPGSLIIRTTFGPRPFPYDRAVEDKVVSKMYADEAAPLVLALAKSAETGIVNVGGERATTLDYARRTRPDVEAVKRADVSEPLHADTSLDLSRLEEIRRRRGF